MKINFNVTGTERKALATAISQELNASAKYLGMPSAAYEVGIYRIDKTGTVTGPDDSGLIEKLENAGFVPVTAEYDGETGQDNAGTADEPTEDTEGEFTEDFGEATADEPTEDDDEADSPEWHDACDREDGEPVGDYSYEERMAAEIAEQIADAPEYGEANETVDIPDVNAG